MSEQIKSKQKFFHLALEGDEIKLSPELRALVADFTEQMIEEYEARKKNCYDLLKAYPLSAGSLHLSAWVFMMTGNRAAR